MKNSFVEVDIEAKDKEEAVRKVGELMYKNGYVTESYIDSMVDVMYEFGPYMVITKGVALPHARPEDGAIKSGFCIIRLKNPVRFGNKENDPVNILIGLSALDNDQHLQNIQDVIEILDNKMDVLLNGSKKQIIESIGGK